MSGMPEPDVPDQDRDGFLDVETRLGPRRIARDRILSMPQGVPGFETLRSFALLTVGAGDQEGGTQGDTQGDNGGGIPFKLLQSLDDVEIAFYVLPIPLENPLILAEDLQALASGKGIGAGGAGFLLMVTLRQIPTTDAIDPQSQDKTQEEAARALPAGIRATVNCQAPLVIDLERRLGWQLIIDKGAYKVQQPL